MVGCAMPTTVASSCAIELPRTVAVRTQRPRAVERCRPADVPVPIGPTEPASVTPLDVTEVAGGLRVTVVSGDTRSARGDRGDRSVAGEDDGLLGEREQLRGDAGDERLEVAPGTCLARAAVEQRVAGNNHASDAERDAPRRLAGRVDDGDPRAPESDLAAVVEPSGDP